MSKLDKIKEGLSSLRTGLSIIAAFVIALSGAVGAMYRSGQIDYLFWLALLLLFAMLAVGFAIIHVIRVKTNELEDL